MPLLAGLALLLTAQLPDGKALDSLAALDQFSGVVVITREGSPVFERAYGMADREAQRPNDVETAFNLGSINKVFTSIAIRQLARAGKLDLDSTLARAWPDYPNQDVARRVTIRQLLEHRSGIGGNIFAAPAGGGGRAATSAACATTSRCSSTNPCSSSPAPAANTRMPGTSCSVCSSSVYRARTTTTTCAATSTNPPG